MGLILVPIAAFAPDEHVAAMFEAVRGMDVPLYVAGNHRKLEQTVAAGMPTNVRFTGFL
jgi:hypothetical protein